MTRIDLEKMEQLVATMKSLDSDSQDVLGKLRKVEDEMSQDADFLLLPQSQSMLQNISAGSTGLMNVNDTILGLYRVIQSLPEEYRKLQQDSLREMETWFRRLGKASSRIQSNMAGMEKN